MSLAQDEALRVYDALRRRMTMRQELLYGGDDLGQVNHLALSEWDEAARATRKAYTNGEITAEDFVRRIDLFHDLDSYDVNAPKTPVKSVWRKLIEQDIRFDPYRELSDMMVLDLDADKPKWEIISSEERTRAVQQGHQSLRVRYIFSKPCIISVIIYSPSTLYPDRNEIGIENSIYILRLDETYFLSLPRPMAVIKPSSHICLAIM